VPLIMAMIGCMWIDGNLMY